MRIATRNRIMTLSMLALYTAGLAAFRYIFVEANGGHNKWVIITTCVGLWLYALWLRFSAMRNISRAERILEEAGVEIPEEEPIPIRLAENRESLIASIIALVIIAAVFVAHFAGWYPKSLR